MSHPRPVTLVRALAERAAGRATDPAPIAARIPVSNYTDPARFAAEHQRLFLRQPQIIGHETQFPEAGDAMVWDWLGLPLITLRDKDGGIATFKNVCRHRGMRLVQEQGQARLRSMVCPYHQWTYGLDGALRNIPRSEMFADVDPASMGLARVATEVRHGLVWVQAEGEMDLDAHLAELGRDLDEFGMADHHFCQQSVRTVDANWKLIQDAFLDAYHVTRLHKDTVGAFFPDSLAESDLIGRHTRSAVARKEIEQAVDLPDGALDLKRHATFSYTVFPGSVLVFQPDYPAIISVFPLGPGQSVFVHSMLTPHPPATDEERDHFERSFRLIDEGVFAAEDVFVAVGTQRGLASGANDHLLFGGLEAAAVRFHELVDSELRRG
jgi:phenylpropionate dioxygenase-like ring-hydroxylating dioxygenase large terminal subunit